VLVAASAVTACGGNQATAPPAPPPVPVTLATLTPEPVDEASEYVATVKSLRSTAVRPQVDGIITRIDVKSGDHVTAGTRLLRIDAQRQQATVSSQEATRAAREADLALARTELERTRALLKGGAVSQQDLDEAEARVKRLEAETTALQAQTHEARVHLQYYDVTAPAPGIIGDVPVRVGNRVTPGDVLTTIDENALLEVLVNVPIERAPSLRRGLPIEILDAGGRKAAATTVSFIAPSVDAMTQTVLVKGTLSGSGTVLRSSQYVHARIVWRRRDALVVPVVAVQRINGQYFVFVAEDQQGKLVARQKPVSLGPITGNTYVVLKGLEPSQRIVASGAQKLVDGAAIAAEARPKTETD
jgi:RND family efflux transporter MFP subunit